MGNVLSEEEEEEEEEAEEEEEEEEDGSFFPTQGRKENDFMIHRYPGRRVSQSGSLTENSLLREWRVAESAQGMRLVCGAAEGAETVDICRPHKGGSLMAGRVHIAPLPALLSQFEPHERKRALRCQRRRIQLCGLSGEKHQQSAILQKEMSFIVVPTFPGAATLRHSLLFTIYRICAWP
ncbi:unnamed protein product [Pleuronectes platessa]|uniref:Uncharacterized protein n=1 Tax=Pleuronectes platessa TaxID=8262 RepID=A0A9N7V6N7_PLEPL|nr:unnamed protein product [Pleuronectes platessa]